LIMKNGTTTSSRNAAISPYSSDIARILLGNIHGRADAPHPALAGCAHAVSGHVAAVHIGSFLRRGNPDPRMSLVGQTRSFGDVGSMSGLPKSGHGEAIYGLEGIVSKRKDSPYRSGISPHWLKFNNPDAPAVKREAEEEWN
jgi:hypothetical protein